MNITCPNCQTKYRIDQARLPLVAKTAKCKVCGHLVPLRPSGGLEPGHSLAKENSGDVSDAPAGEPPRPDAGLSDILVFSCAGCGKKYQITRQKIPPGITAVKCKVCGHRISLQQAGSRTPTDDYLQSKAQLNAPSVAGSDPGPAEKPRVIRRSRKKRWLAALAAGILLVAVWGARTHRDMIDWGWLMQLFPGKSGQATKADIVLENQPLKTGTGDQSISESMGLIPSAGEVEIRYVPESDFVSAVDVDRLKAGIPHIIADCLFPGNFLDSGDKPMMTLDLDPVDIPNAALAELTYEVKSIRSAEGRDVLRVEKSTFRPSLQPGSLFPGNIALNIKKGTAPDTLGKATIDFHLSLPTVLKIFDFNMGDKGGIGKEVDGVHVTLDRLEKDVARVSSNRAESIRLIAYDQGGNALAAKESMQTSASASARFYGLIDTLKVVVIRDMLEYPFEVEVDLNGGKALTLAREAQIPPRIRYNRQPVPVYVDFSAEDIQKLSVTWTEGQPDAWNDSLSIKLPGGTFSGNAVWEVHFFGNDNKPRVLTGNSIRSNTEVSYTLDKGILKQVSAAFGKVQLNLHSDIKRLTFFRKEGLQPDVRQLASGEEVSVVFNKNEVIYSTGSAEVIQTAAFDARGKRLKEDPYTRNKGDKCIVYFWGVPAKLVIDVSTKTIKQLLPFEIKQRPVNEKAYLAYRRLIENQREVVKTIKAIDRARRGDRSYYGDDLAGLYYLYDQKTRLPMRLISQDVAHSDPAGQQRFGYQVKPYKGYFFTVLSGIETNGTNKGYNRRLKKSSFSWQNGTIVTTALTRHPDLAAIPEDGSQPTFFLQWGQVFMKPLNGEKLAYLPDGYYNNGWVEAKFIEN
jgi:predicted Zn finger-like uncharacterized protein